MTAMTYPAQPPQPQPRPMSTLNTYDARSLVKDDAQACIMLDGTAYYLRITRAGKLILTK